MGGVFNSINLDAFHYAGDNPVKLVDPDGNEDIIFVEDINKQNTRLESEALVYKDGTFKSQAFQELKEYAEGLALIGLCVTKGEVEGFLGKPEKVFENISTLPDDTTEYGTIQSGKEYSYIRHDFNDMEAYSLSDSELGGGKVPQDSKYGSDIPIKGVGRNPCAWGRWPAYLFGAHIHRSNSSGAGSKGCIIQKGFESKDGLGYYLRNSSTGQKGNIIIFRAKGKIKWY